MLKFSVGYQLRSDGKWVDSIIANKVNVVTARKYWLGFDTCQ